MLSKKYRNKRNKTRYVLVLYVQSKLSSHIKSSPVFLKAKVKRKPSLEQSEAILCGGDLSPDRL